MKITLTTYVGTEDGVLERVQMAFQSYGFIPPKVDQTSIGTETHHGFYVGNIVSDYVGSLSQWGVFALIRYGMVHNKEYLQQCIDDYTYHVYTLQQIEDDYRSTYDSSVQ